MLSARSESIRPRSRAEANILQNAGFTIVETIIVLAIAGLILLLVFYAVPTLERNGRNSQRKQDVSTILQGVSHYELDNSANFPTNVTTLLKYAPQNLAWYIPSDIQLNPGQVAAPAVTSTEDVEIYDFEFCSSTTFGSTTNQGADYSNIVALYAVEGGGGAVSECQQL